MERFVCKLPKEGTQEISSTNDIDKKDVKDSSKDREIDEDCIILDKENNQEVKIEKMEDKTIHEEEGIKEVAHSPQKDESSDRENTCGSKEKTVQEPETQINKSANESLLVSGTDISITPHKEDERTNETLEVSLNESSFLSGTELASTPYKDANTSSNSITSKDTPTNSSTPKNPSQKKKGPKVKSSH